MSHEYVASLATPIADLAKVLPYLHLMIVVPSESQASGQLPLRWRGAAQREQWPEDLKVWLDGGRLGVAFHGATADQRDAGLANLAQAIFQASALRVTFEEL